MVTSTPFFADLSTYSLEHSLSFYEKVFNWKYHKSGEYYTAFFEGNEVAGFYKTPLKFRQMRMPHFWMTYINVASVTKTIEKAKRCGGILEMNSRMEGYGNIALIRDPKGAGFTICDGYEPKLPRVQNVANMLVWNELHVSNANDVIPFYKALFDWEVVKGEENRFSVLDTMGRHITDIIEISNEYKGKYEYWVCSFGVKNLLETTDLILANNGTKINVENNRIMFSDNSNEAFFYIKEVANSR